MLVHQRQDTLVGALSMWHDELVRAVRASVIAGMVQPLQEWAWAKAQLLAT